MSFACRNCAGTTAQAVYSDVVDRFQGTPGAYAYVTCSACGLVQLGGGVRDVCVACQPDAEVGDYVLVHVGFAIARLDAAEAARTWALLRELGELDDLGPEEIEEEPT